MVEPMLLGCGDHSTRPGAMRVGATSHAVGHADAVGRADAVGHADVPFGSASRCSEGL